MRRLRRPVTHASPGRIPAAFVEKEAPEDRLNAVPPGRAAGQRAAPVGSYLASAFCETDDSQHE